MNIKKIIIILAIIALVMVTCILVLLNYEKDKQHEKDFSAADEVVVLPTINKELKQVTIRNNFYLVQNCINKFYECYSGMHNESLEKYYLLNADESVFEHNKTVNKKKLYNLLDNEYLKFKGITLDNMESIFPKIGITTINIKKMYVMQKDERIFTYFVYGNTIDSLNDKSKDVSLMVKIDMKNRTFKILLQDYIEKYYKNIQDIQKYEIKENEIQNNSYNEFAYEHIKDDQYVDDLFKHFKNELKISKEQTFNLIDETYKKQCFDEVNEYLEYLNPKYSKIITAKILSYAKKQNENYTEYLAIDNEENYYIFRETAPFQYTIMLGNYTIPTEEFIEEYNNSTEVEKAVLNIKRFFMGIDDKNYGYSYSVLSDSFKNNKYPTKKQFIEYIKQNLFEENEINYISYQKENGLYIYKIKITDPTGKSKSSKTLNIIIKLNNGTDYEISFGED